MGSIHHCYRLSIVTTRDWATVIIVDFCPCDGHVVHIYQIYKAARSCPPKVLCVIAMTQNV